MQLIDSVGAPVLSIAGASKSYDGIPVLKDVSLDLYGGEVRALIGENGAGKSTLIKLLVGAVPADTMALKLAGKSHSFLSVRDAYRAGLRFIHQELNVVSRLSVAENIFLGQPYPTWGGVLTHWPQLYAQAQQALTTLGIDHIDVRQLISQLSPGDQMLVKIASAFVAKPSADDTLSEPMVYVLDEPTSALEAADARLLFQVIETLRQRGCAILYVTHRLEEVFEIADRVTVMRDGRIVATEQTAAVSTPDLIRLMTGRDMQQVYPARQPGPDNALLLEVKGLCTDFLQNISFRLDQGEILGVAGLNGSGRTALLRALMGAEPFSGGEMRLAGGSYRPTSPAQAWARGVGYVPEERRSQGLVLTRSIYDNMLLSHLRYHSRAGLLLKHREARQLSVELGKTVRLRAASSGQTVRQLSGGNQQKVVFARATGRAPRLLLLDEPTRGIDIGAKFDLYNFIRQLAEGGTAILMASSEPGELLGLCDRILVLRQGRVQMLVSASDVTEESLLAHCFGEIPHDE